MARKDKRPVVGVDVGGTNIEAGVVDRRGRVVARCKLRTRAEDGPKAVVERIATAVERATEEADLKLRNVAAIGVGAPGAVDIEHGVVLRAPNLRWNRLPLADRLRKALGVPVVVDNDVNVAAWGEHQVGAGRRYDDLLAVWVGTGIGGGLILGGRMFYGHHLTAGEIGHTVIHADAMLGRRTLENCASRTAVVNQLLQLLAANHASRLLELAGGDPSQVRSRVLAEAVRTGDDLAVEVVQHAARYVGVAVANTVTMLSLPCVVLGGGLTEALGGRWVEWVREAFAQAVFPEELRSCRVVASKLGDDAGIVGAALLARSKTVEKSVEKRRL